MVTKPLTETSRIEPCHQMTDLGVRTFGDPTHAPDIQGIYAICLNMPSLHSLGHARMPPAVVENSARLHMSKLLRLQTGRKFAGVMHEVNKVGPRQRGMEVTAGDLPIDLQYLCGSSQVLAAYKLVRMLQPLFPPLYVGVAIGQSIQSRLHQHRYDLENDVQDNVFGRRARASNLAWSDLSFSWVTANSPEDLQALTAVERVLQAVIAPALSDR